MPSLQHTIVSWIVPLLRRNMAPQDVPAMRATLIKRNRLSREGPPQDVRRSHEESISNVHGFPVFELWAAGTEPPGRAVLYLHGGAFVHPADKRHWRFATRLADALGARTVQPAYPLAPEFTVEDSFEEMVAIFEAVAAASPEGVVLVGDPWLSLPHLSIYASFWAGSEDREVLVGPKCRGSSTSTRCCRFPRPKRRSSTSCTSAGTREAPAQAP